MMNEISKFGYMPYQYVIVESYIPQSTAGFHGSVHIRPVAGQGFEKNMHVECSKELSRNFPVGTKFKIKAKVTDRQGGKPFLYSSYRWAYEKIS